MCISLCVCINICFFLWYFFFICTITRKLFKYSSNVLVSEIWFPINIAIIGKYSQCNTNTNTNSYWVYQFPNQWWFGQKNICYPFFVFHDIYCNIQFECSRHSFNISSLCFSFLFCCCTNQGDYIWLCVCVCLPLLLLLF